MTDNEVIAIKWMQVKNISIAVCAAALVLGLFYMSKSWLSLSGLLPLFWLSSVSTN